MVFSEILKARPYTRTEVPYMYFLLSSFFFWLAFSEGIFRASFSIVENAETVKKISFPNALLPISVTISCYLLNMVGFILFLIFYSFTTSPSYMFVLIIPVLFFQFIFSVGLGMLLSALLPYIRDIGQVLGHVLQAAFFLSPIIYSLESVPEKFRTLLYLNPMTFFVSSYHKIIIFREFPPLFYIGTIVCISFGTFIGGFYVFRKLKAGFADVL
jgi:ABC-type polysaccharide/polyol phosphate export permease